MKSRVQRIVQQAGLASRRHAEDFIRAGRVAINGRVAQIGDMADPEQDQVTVDGKPVTPESHVIWLALHKPKGYTTSLKDRHAAHLISELVPKKYGRVFPVGRLDRDTTGLILLTNDGRLAFRLMHPGSQVPKVYEAWVKGIPRGTHIDRIRDGILLDDGVARADRIDIIKRREGTALIRLTLTEGRKREVRRIFEAVGHPVIALTRIRYASVTLEGLEEGAIRPLARREVRELEKVPAKPKAPPREKIERTEDSHGKSRRRPKAGGFGDRPGPKLPTGKSRHPVGNSRGNQSRPHR